MVGRLHILKLFCTTLDVMSPRHCDDIEVEIEMIMGG